MKPNCRSIRLPGYEYASAGWYFVTMCCKDRTHLFREIRDGEMVLNEAEKIAEECWMQIPEHFPDVAVHELVVMPNHIHGIIEINVGAENFLPLQPSTNKFQKMISRSVSSVIKGFKIGVTKEIRKVMPDVQVWQRNYLTHHPQFSKGELQFAPTAKFQVTSKTILPDGMRMIIYRRGTLSQLCFSRSGPVLPGRCPIRHLKFECSAHQAEGAYSAREEKNR